MLRRAREKNNCILNKVQEEAFSCETFPDRLTKQFWNCLGKAVFCTLVAVQDLNWQEKEVWQMVTAWMRREHSP